MSKKTLDDETLRRKLRNYRNIKVAGAIGFTAITLIASPYIALRIMGDIMGVEKDD